MLGIRPATADLPQSACMHCRRYRPVTGSAGWCTVHTNPVAASETCNQHRREGERAARRSNDPIPLTGISGNEFLDGITRQRQAERDFQGLILSRIGATPEVLDPGIDVVFNTDDDTPEFTPPDRFVNRWRQARDARLQQETNRVRIRNEGRCRNCFFAERGGHRTLTCTNAFVGETDVLGDHRCASWEPQNPEDRDLLGLNSQEPVHPPATSHSRYRTASPAPCCRSGSPRCKRQPPL